MNKKALWLIVLSVLIAGIGLWLCAPPPPPPPPGGKVDPTPGTIPFGEVYVGQTGRGTCAWTNNTNQNFNMMSAGTADAGFGFDANTFTAGNLAAGAKTGNLTFTFSPSEDKVYDGKGALAGIGAQSSKVGLNGTGVYRKAAGTLTLAVPAAAGAAAGTPAPKFLDFGKVKATTPATPLSVTITNSDPNNAVQVTATWTTGGQGFAVANPPGNAFAIPKAGSITVNITFTPAQIQTYSDAVTFSDAAGRNLCGVVTQGEGIE